MIFLGALSGAVLVYCLFVLCSNLLFSKKIKVGQRLQNIADLNKTVAYEEEPSNPLGKRIIKSAVDWLIELFTVFIPKSSGSLENLSQQLKQADIHMNARNYRAAVLLFMVLCIILGTGLGVLFADSLMMDVLFGAIGLYAGFTLSRFLLRSKISQRKKDMYHQLPEMLDLLSVSVSAGLGFDQALTYVVKKSEGALIQELDVAQREITLGRPRKEALVGLADRCDNLEMRTFVSAVLQADEMGSSMRNILQIQADTIRQAHKQGVEERAQKLSIKMLFPLVFFIFPVMFIVLMGPALLSIFDVLAGGL